MQEAILNFLRKKQDYISGEEISKQLGISRQALWKHTQELREAGYDIVAVPHLGYCLVSSPDRLFPYEIANRLHTKIIGKKVYYFDDTASTMDVAMRLGMEGAAEGTLVVAETQAKGKGRLGRSWISPQYKGIYVSLVLRPDIAPNTCPVLTLLTAVSICEAIKTAVGIDVQIKWPNDIFIQNKKLGGILTELNAEMDVTSFIVIGIGINVNTDKKTLPSQATSLKEQKKEHVNRAELLQEILRALEANYVLFQKEGSAFILEKWRSFSTTLGRRVKVACQHEQIEGEAVDIDRDGGLLLRDDSGLMRKVMSGDIIHCR
ncbi:MAG: biotin--[acetyl-CoA-carboxylase] ligase [Candidatus Omnitrophota bacterium]|jgi:BirA family biotin operon repressor/biotin-[acetyl-CoA-carboxylase] ligase